MPKLALSVPNAPAKSRSVRRIRTIHNPRHAAPGATPSDALLAALDAVSDFAAAPSYRRRRIERTVEALIAILDAMDADPDTEPEEDRCDAGDDLLGIPAFHDGHPGDPDDAEAEEDCCAAADDVGSSDRITLGTRGDGLPGDPDDAEEGGDREHDDPDDPFAPHSSEFIAYPPVTNLFAAHRREVADA